MQSLTSPAQKIKGIPEGLPISSIHRASDKRCQAEMMRALQWRSKTLASLCVASTDTDVGSPLGQGQNSDAMEIIRHFYQEAVRSTHLQ